MAIGTLPAEHPADSRYTQRLVLPAVDWDTYRKLSDALTGRHIRVSYDGSTLGLMTISPLHANLCRLFARFIVVLTEEFGLPLRSFGDMTCDREDLQRALEPDECFYITSEPTIRGKLQIDLREDAPPDLAVEVELSPSRPDRVEIYAELAVPEVWRYDGKSIVVLQLGADGKYVPADESRFFPQIPVAELTQFIDRRSDMDENSLIQSFREWVRQRIGKRG